MLVRVETSRVGPARLPSAASWRVSSSFAYRIHWRLGRSEEKSAQVVEAARKPPWGGRVTGSTSRFQAARRQAARYYAEAPPDESSFRFRRATKWRAIRMRSVTP